MSETGNDAAAVAEKRLRQVTDIGGIDTMRAKVLAT
jgi:hypothetical protein